MLPAEFLSSLSGVPGFRAEPFQAVHASGAQVTSIRINPAKWTGASGLSFPPGERIPWTEYGIYLEQRPFFTFEPWLHAGAFYVQEASSMFLEQAVKQCLPDEPLVVLDGCAAPGGKSTHLQSLLPGGSVLVSNEVIKTRVNVLEENLVKWGSANSIITSSDPAVFSQVGAVFDAMVIDAPCSGSGLFRRDAAAIDEWSADLVKLCSQRQQRILADYLPALKPGGCLIYSTCSYSMEEDEAIGDWLVQHFDLEPLPLQLDKSWQVVESVSAAAGAHGYRFYPDRLKGEGFFLAAFRKKDSAAPGRAGRGKTAKLEPVSKKQILIYEKWLNAREPVKFFQVGESTHALTNGIEYTLMNLPGVYIRYAGIRMGKLAGEQLVPDPALAWSTWLAGDVPVLSLGREEALQYLRKEEVLPAGDKRGWSLVAFEGQRLGWIKLLGNRANNYYPKEWRILKAAGGDRR